MFSGVGWPSLMPILIARGIGRSVAEPLPGSGQQGCAAQGYFGNSLSAGIAGFVLHACRIFISAHKPSILIRIPRGWTPGRWLPALPKFEKIPKRTREPGPSAGLLVFV